MPSIPNMSIQSPIPLRSGGRVKTSISHQGQFGSVVIFSFVFSILLLKGTLLVFYNSLYKLGVAAGYSSYHQALIKSIKIHKIPSTYGGGGADQHRERSVLVLLSQPVLLLPSLFDLCSFSLLSSSSSSSIQGQKEKVVLVLIWGDPVYLKIARDLVSDDVMHVPSLSK